MRNVICKKPFAFKSCHRFPGLPAHTKIVLYLGNVCCRLLLVYRRDIGNRPPLFRWSDKLMVHVLTNIFLLTLLFFVAACPGLKFLKLLNLDKRSPLELFVLSAAAGFALLCETLVIVGMMGFFRPAVICLIPIGFFLMSAREALFSLRSLINFLRTFRFSLSPQCFLVAAFGVFVGINILKCFLPPHGPTDVLYYHLMLPKLYLFHNAIVTHPTLFPSFFPSNGEVLFSLSLLLGGPVFVNLTVFGFGLLTVMALYTYAQKYVRKEFALIPGIIFLTAPVVNSWGTMAYTDNILGLYLFLMCMLLLEHKNTPGWNLVILSGVMTGMAMGSRYQAVPMICLIFCGILITDIKKWKQLFLLFLFTMTVGVAFASPWFIRNVVITGNPLYPLLQDNFFRQGQIPSAAMYGSIGSLLNTAWRTFRDCYFIPFSYLFSGALISESADYERFIGPLFLCLAPFVFFIRNNLIKWPFIFITILLSYLCVGMFLGNVRYFVIMIILLSLLGGAVFQEIFLHAGKNVRIFLAVALSLVIFGFSFENYRAMLSYDRILTALNPDLTPFFLRTFERSYRPAEWANKNLPDDAKVLFHGCFRYFYFKFEPFNDYYCQNVITYDNAMTAEDILAIMHKHGFTYIIWEKTSPVCANNICIMYNKDHRFIDFTNKYLEKLYSENYIAIYRIRYPNGP